MKLTAAMLAKTIHELKAMDAVPSHIDLTRAQFENLVTDIGASLCYDAEGSVNRFMGIEIRVKELK